MEGHCDPAWTARRLLRRIDRRRRLALPMVGCLLALGWLLVDPGGHLVFPRDYLLVFTWFNAAYRPIPTLHLAPLAFYASLMGTVVCGGQCYALSCDIRRLRVELMASRTGRGAPSGAGAALAARVQRG